MIQPEATTDEIQEEVDTLLGALERRGEVIDRVLSQRTELRLLCESVNKIPPKAYRSNQKM